MSPALKINAEMSAPDQHGGPSLRAVQRRALQAVGSELDALSTMIETNAIAVSERFQGIARESASQTDAMSRLIDATSQITVDGRALALSELASSVQVSLNDLVGKIIYLSSRGMKMVFALEDLLAQMREVGNSVSRIERISSQTNLLALNARIEAAHAGDAGRGFAVVSNEVRDLANHTAAISRELRQRIESASAGLSDSFALLKEISTIDMAQENVFTNERVGMIVNALIDQHERFGTALGEASEMATRLTGEVNEAVMRMQFQDRATQCIQNLRAVLLAVTETLDHEGTGSTPGGAAAAEILSRISLGDMRERLAAGLDGRTPASPPAHSPSAAADIELF